MCSCSSIEDSGAARGDENERQGRLEPPPEAGRGGADFIRGNTGMLRATRTMPLIKLGAPRILEARSGTR